MNNIQTDPALLLDLTGNLGTVRGWLISMVNGTASANDMLAIDDAIARSGHLLRRANGEDVSAAVAAYEASLVEPNDYDDEVDDGDFGRYGCCDDYSD